MPGKQSSTNKEFIGSPSREKGILGQNWNDLRLKREPYTPLIDYACTFRSLKATTFENKPWQHLFQKRDHSFDMLADAHSSSKHESESAKPSRPAKFRIDPHRERKVHLEYDAQGNEKHTLYTAKVARNSQRFRGFLESQHTPRRTFGLDHSHDPGKSGPRTHPDSLRWMVNLRGGPREGEEFRDLKAQQEKLAEEKAKQDEKAKTQ